GGGRDGGHRSVEAVAGEDRLGGGEEPAPLGLGIERRPRRAFGGRSAAIPCPAFPVGLCRNGHSAMVPAGSGTGIPPTIDEQRARASTPERDSRGPRAFRARVRAAAVPRRPRAA